MTVDVVLGIAVCCTRWLVAIGWSMGKCGKCNTQPIVDPEQDFEMVVLHV